VTLNLILIPIWGVTGAAIATSSALVAASVFNWLAARRLEGLNLFVLANLPRSRPGA
jgi:O-antigen/teichoic acid export membrane protein